MREQLCCLNGLATKNIERWADHQNTDRLHRGGRSEWRPRWMYKAMRADTAVLLRSRQRSPAIPAIPHKGFSFD
jgi:hypothetical protein